MSKINAVRLINLGYNNNTVRIDDEIFEFRRESTFMSLRNGGGKSVLVQMMMAPFVTKSYRDIKEREFQSYFTSSKPTYILVDWVLDNDKTHVLVGMMVRKKQQGSDEDSKDNLDIVNFIHEYKERNQYDIHSIPLVEMKDNKKTVKSYVSTKEMLESLKKDKNISLNYYDMTNSSQSRSYFEKLKEYKINNKEWQSIIRKINLKESGLSELFADSKNVEGLVEKWFLKTVEEKLNQDEDRIDKFRKIIMKYIKQYKENSSKIDKKNLINLFFNETLSVKALAEDFKTSEVTTKDFENRIANLILNIDNKLSEGKNLDENLRDDINNILEEIDKIEHEKISLEIYNIEDKTNEIRSKLNDLEEKITKGDQEEKSLENHRDIFRCAKIYGEYVEASKLVQRIENDLEVLRKKDEDLAPERNNLGYSLRKYYEGKEVELEEVHISCIDDIKNSNEDLELKNKNINSEQYTLNSFNKKDGELNEKIKSYTEGEEDFNKRYGENIKRNLIGEYKDGVLLTLENKYKDEDLKLQEDIINLKKLNVSKKEELASKQRDKEDKVTAKVKKTEGLKEVKKALEKYEDEIKIRKEIIRYIEFKEHQLFKKEDIVNEFNKRISSVKDREQNLYIEIKALEEERMQLQTGRIMQLQKEVEEKLIAKDINIVYGLEWLQKNENSLEENNILVENNPFIPYSIILSNRDIEKLKNEDIDMFTSYPISIIRKEDLREKSQGKVNKVYDLGKVQFLVSFNNKLMDEQGLKELINTINNKIEALTEEMNLNKSTLDMLESHRNKFKYWELDEKTYNSTILEIEDLSSDIAIIEKDLINLRQEVVDMGVFIEKNEDELKKKQLREQNLINKLRDFNLLIKKYDTYVENIKLRNENDEAILKSKEIIKALEEKIKELRTKINSDRERKTQLEKVLNDIGEKASKFRTYVMGEIIEKDIEDLESRYESLTKEINQKEQELEEQLTEANKKYKDKEAELIDTQEHHKLKEESYRQVIYDRYKEREIEDKIKETMKILKSLEKDKSNYEKQKSVNENEIKHKVEEIFKKFNTKDLVERANIIEINFQEKINGKNIAKKKLEKNKKDIEVQIRLIENNKAALSEYVDFKIAHDLEMNIDYSNLDKFRGELVRDYKLSIEDKNRKQSMLEKDIGRVLRIEDFRQDNFFKNPLEVLYKISSRPLEVLENLALTLDSYKALMDKLEADIELINKEKESVINTLFDYIYDIHENIGKIDKNSTVNIRGRSIKMLKIKTSSWDENKEIYRIRLRDVLDNLTQKAIDRLDGNENIEDLISKEITTKNLYNEVVTISSIDVRLYKIEEEREVPISWDEVSKNSGGEGFLSAFVILSSLLSYIRRDDTDIFAENESGKVIVMDNPFAQTNAVHLLKPLMEIAKKSNTQLICLSGLGGESIHDRFENIYVLNLVSSKLRSGVKYLKADHRKGEEEVETLISSNIRLEEDTEEVKLF